MASRAAMGPLAPLLWFALTFLIARPLADGPVADSWIYARSVKSLMAGVLAFPGYTAAMPVTQVLYGALWSRLFGLNYVSLDLSVAVLGAGGGVLFYLLACRCGAGRTGAALATALLVANPCYLFLSFSFMTDVPFVATLIAAYLAFAASESGWESRWLWVCAALLVAAFLMRPFALAAIAGCAAAMMLPQGIGCRRPPANLRRLLPLAAALAVSLGLGLWLTTVRQEPWMLEMRQHLLSYLYLVPVPVYFVDALLAPLLYLGLVLSPLALPHLAGARWRLGLAIAAGLAAIVVPAVMMEPSARSIPELSCCGGWNNVLVLRGLPLRFVWAQPAQLAALILAVLGVAGIVLAALEVGPSTRAFLAVLITAAIYWGGMVPLWFFNDRYYLVMLPAGCLLLAVAPLPRGWLPRAVALAMLAVLGWIAVAGVYDQQRGLDAVMAARDALTSQGVPRRAIDAGYPLNGNDLYRTAEPGQKETFAMEAGIPLITSRGLSEYTIASAPLPGSLIVKRFGWPGILGFGRRDLYVLRTFGSAPSSAEAGRVANTRPGLLLPPRTDLSAQPAIALIMARLAMMALSMVAPLLAVVAAFLLPSGSS